MNTVYEYNFTRTRIGEAPTRSVRDHRDAADVARMVIHPDERESECLAVILLDTKNHVLGGDIVYVGSVNAANARVGELFRAAVRVNASAIIVTHNHPSGDPTPSPDDLHLTAQVLAGGKILDIAVLDHIVLGTDGAYRSLREMGVSFDRPVGVPMM